MPVPDVQPVFAHGAGTRALGQVVVKIVVGIQHQAMQQTLVSGRVFVRLPGLDATPLATDSQAKPPGASQIRWPSGVCQMWR